MNDPMLHARAVHFAATVALAGVILFVVFIFDDALRRAPSDGGAKMSAIVMPRFGWIAWISAALMLLSGAAWLVSVAQSMSERALADVFSSDILALVLSDTDFGRDWLVRLGLLILLAILLPPFLAIGRRPAWVKLLVLGLAASLLGTLAWAGHAAGGSGAAGFVYLAADVIHLVAAGTWLGMLLPLAVVLAAAAATPSVGMARDVTLRFSGIGVAAVGTLIVTGAVNTWHLAGGPGALPATEYGRLLLLKLALFLGMVAVAAINRLRLTPQLADSAAESARGQVLRQLCRNVAIEIAAGAAILAIVAALGVTPPGVDQQAGPHLHHSH